MYLKPGLRTLFLASLVFVVGLAQNSSVVKDPEGKYEVTLPKSRTADQEKDPNAVDWHGVESVDGLGRKQVEIVYKVREECLLKIRKMDIEKGGDLLEFIKSDESQTLAFLSGYSKNTTEDFSVGGGKIPARVLSYEYLQSGRPKMGRSYYIRVSDTAVYLLKFTGNRNTVGVLRSQTDSIARSLKVNP